jgi:hypothetical protein
MFAAPGSLKAGNDLAGKIATIRATGLLVESLDSRLHYLPKPVAHALCVPRTQSCVREMFHCF